MTEEPAINPRDLVQTPTVSFTAGGLLCVILWRVFHVPYADIAAFSFFGLAGMGTGMALGSEVMRKHYTWGWRGVVGAVCRHPTKKLLVGFFGHLVQLLAAVVIALYWRRGKK